LEDPGVDGRIRLHSIKEWDDGIDWIDLAQDRNKWRALVNVAINLQFP
jgi:hypothetical protein